MALSDSGLFLPMPVCQLWARLHLAAELHAHLGVHLTEDIGGALQLTRRRQTFSRCSSSCSGPWRALSGGQTAGCCLPHCSLHISFSASRMLRRVQNLAGLVSHSFDFCNIATYVCLMGVNTGDPRQSEKGGRWDSVSRKGLDLPVPGSGFGRCLASIAISEPRPLGDAPANATDVHAPPPLLLLPLSALGPHCHLPQTQRMTVSHNHC